MVDPVFFGRVELVIDDVVECVFEGAGKQLPLQVNGNETGLVSICL